jgi:hypothetical protein
MVMQQMVQAQRRDQFVHPACSRHRYLSSRLDMWMREEQEQRQWSERVQTVSGGEREEVLGSAATVGDQRAMEGEGILVPPADDEMEHEEEEKAAT